MKTKENYTGFKGIVKFITNVVSWTALVILILLAIFLAYYTINTKLYEKKGEKFEPFISLYTIVSGSMEPNIKIGDVVVSKKVKSPTKKKTTSKKSVEASSKGEVKKVTKKTSNTGKEKKDTTKNSAKKVVKEPVKKTSVKGSSSKTTTKKSTTKKTK